MATPVEQSRTDELGAVLNQLSAVLVEEQSLQDTLQLVADLAVQVVQPCDAAAVTLFSGGRYRTAAYTNDNILGFDRAQYDTGVGPWVEASRELRTVIGNIASSWPPLVPAAQQLGVHSVLAAPLLRGAQCIGALNFYSAAQNAFTGMDEHLVQLFTNQAAVALANALVYQDAVRLTQQLQEALSARVVIEQAKGVLIASKSLTPEQAFDLLRTHSQARNIKLREIAEQVVQARGDTAMVN